MKWQHAVVIVPLWAGMVAGPWIAGRRIRARIMHSHCSVVTEKPAPRGCVYSADGSSFSCDIGDIPPESWGVCIEGVSTDFFCMKDGVISHYGPYSSAPTWQMPQVSCPQLEQQIEKDGQGGERSSPPIINLPPKVAPQRGANEGHA